MPGIASQGDSALDRKDAQPLPVRLVYSAIGKGPLEISHLSLVTGDFAERAGHSGSSLTLGPHLMPWPKQDKAHRHSQYLSFFSFWQTVRCLCQSAALGLMLPQLPNLQKVSRSIDCQWRAILTLSPATQIFRCVVSAVCTGDGVVLVRVSTQQL